MGKGNWSGIAALWAALSLSSCAQLQQALSLEAGRGDTLEEVDSLLGRVEHVYIECERAELRVGEAMSRLHGLVAADFDGDASQSFFSFQEAIFASEEQASLLRESVEPLERSAERFFSNWESDLSSFRGEAMRERSRTRLEETRARYRAIMDELAPALPLYVGLNEALADQALFLQNDFNASAVRSLEPAVRSATQTAKALAGRLRTAREAARLYVEEAALRGQLGSEPESVSERADTRRQ